MEVIRAIDTFENRLVKFHGFLLGLVITPLLIMKTTRDSVGVRQFNGMSMGENVVYLEMLIMV